VIIHQNQLISEDVLEKQFVCNLSKCKGACCIEGDAGAPVSREEMEILKQELPAIRPFMEQKQLDWVDEKGFAILDEDDEFVTECLPTGECVFVVREESGLLSCAIEQAWKAGKTTFRKPISCHLYPIRILKLGEFEALNYHRWDICKDACSLGNELKVPVYRFLKDSLIRRFGEAWYKELEAIAQAYYAEKGWTLK